MTPLVRVVLRTAPWAPVIALMTGAAALLGCAMSLRHSGIAGLLIVLSVGAGAGASAFLLDEPSLEVADATPASRGRRTVWRATLAPLVAGALGAGLIVVSRQPAPAGQDWSRLWVTAPGAVGLGLGLAAVLKHVGHDAPGDVASVTALAIVALVATANPLQHWVTGMPLGSGAAATRSAGLWGLLGALGLVTTALLERDPGR